MSPRPKRLYLLRHGQAEPLNIDDDHRALTTVGLVQAANIAQFMRQLSVKPDLLAISPLVRTRQTAQCLQDILAIDNIEIWPELVHSSTPNAVDNRLQASPYHDVVLVSHMPLIAALEHYLITGDSLGGAPFQTAELSVLSSEEQSPYPSAWQHIQRVKP